MSAVAEIKDDFELFYRQYRPLVYAVAFKIVRNALDAEDTVQTVFLKVWSRPGAYRGGNIESWLTTVTKNASLDCVRQSWRVSPFASADGYAGRLSPGEDLRTRDCRAAEDEAVHRISVAAVMNALADLCPEQRAAIVAAFVKQQTHRGIADGSCLPLGTVKTRIRSGLAKLRRRFSEEAP